MNYFVLIFAILSGFVAFVATILFVVVFYRIKSGELEGDDLHRLRRVGVSSCCVALFTLFCTYNAFNHLASSSPETIGNFWLWYLIGFVSRVPLLQYKGFIFDPHFGTDWGEVVCTFFSAFLGPIQIGFTVWRIYKHWKNPWPWEK